MIRRSLANLSLFTGPDCNCLLLVLASLLLPAVCFAVEPTAWVDERQQGPFEIHSEFSLTAYRETLAELPKLERELQRVLALRPCRSPISVYLFKDEASHKQYLVRRFPTVPYRRALFVKHAGQPMVFAYRQEELAVDLRHECTHALLHTDLAMLPLWLDEGLAEYFEMPADDRAFNHPHGLALRWNLRLGLVASVRALESKQDLADLTIGDYRASWAWVHYMLHGPREASEQLWSYLATIRKGEPPGPLSARLEASDRHLSRSFSNHFRQWQKLRVAAAKP